MQSFGTTQAFYIFSWDLCIGDFFPLQVDGRDDLHLPW